MENNMCIQTIKTWQIIGVIIYIIKILVPLIVMIIGTINIAKLIVSSNPDDVKPSVIQFLKQLLAAILIFFVPSIIDSLIKLLVDNDTSNFNECRTCLFHPTENECENYIKTYKDSRKRLEEENIYLESENLNTDTLNDSSSSNNSSSNSIDNIKSSKSNLEDSKKTYSSRTEIGKIYVGDSTRIIKVYGDNTHKYAQSCTVVNGNIVTTLTSSSFSSNKATSNRVDTYTVDGKKIKSAKAKLGHANGIDYISNTNDLVVTGINNNSLFHKIYFINYDNYYNNQNIKIKSKTLPTKASEVAYDPSSDKLYVRHKPTITIYDASSLKEEGSIKEVGPNKRDQDMTVYKGLLLVGVNESRLSNWIDIYRLSDKKYLGSYHILSEDGKYRIELESVSTYSDKKLVLYFNRNKEFAGEVHLVNIDI